MYKRGQPQPYMTIKVKDHRARSLMLECMDLRRKKLGKNSPDSKQRVKRAIADRLRVDDVISSCKTVGPKSFKQS
jgi:hypothetical protein